MVAGIFQLRLELLPNPAGLRLLPALWPRKLVMIAARDDKIFPIETIKILYARAREPKEMIWTESGHVRSKDTDLIADIVRQIDRYLE